MATKKRNHGLAVVVCALVGVSFAAAQPCLIISEIVDADLPGGLPKFVELTNTGTTSLDMSQYSLGSINNGFPDSFQEPVTLTGILHPGDHYVCSFEDGDYPPDHGLFYLLYQFFPDAWEFDAWINGNDVIVLYEGNPGAPHAGTPAEGMIDIYGRVGEGAGEGEFDWDYTDGRSYRKNSVAQPNQTFTPGEWTVQTGSLADQDFFFVLENTSPGSHAFGSGCGAGLTVGRCCVDWMCYEVEAATCTTLGGVYQGDGLNCNGTPCGPPPVLGACCYDETCLRQTEEECVGVYNGDGTWCTPNPCLSCITIPEAKALPLESEVQFCEVVVTNVLDVIGSSTLKSFHVQELDLSGGITLFGTNGEIDEVLNWVDPGDTIRIQGFTDSYSGLFELVAPYSFDPDTDILSTGGDLPEPVRLTPTEFSDDYESMLIVVECATFRDAGGTFDGFTTYIADTEGPYGSFEVRVATDNLPIVGSEIPAGRVNVRGILSDFNGFQLLVRFPYDPFNPFDPGDVYPDPECLLTGACCLVAPDYETCVVMSEDDCYADPDVKPGFEWEGGSRCNPFNPCLDPYGACCLPGGLCEERFEIDCIAQGGGYVGDYTSCESFTCAKPGVGGDIALGLNLGDAQETAEQIRDDGTGTAGVQIGSWSRHSFVQSFEYDNTDGVLHNARGNLLALNFGASGGDDPGMKLLSFATDGTGRSQDPLFKWNGNDQGDDPNYATRGGGLGVSTDNRFVSTFGYDQAKLYILAYDEGPEPGSGTGAAITGYWYNEPQTDPNSPLTTGRTQGTTWYWEPGVDDLLNPTTYRVLAANVGAGRINVNLVEFDAPNPGTGMTATQKAVVYVPATIQGTDIEYNPNVSPYIYVIAGGSSPYPTYIGIVDPTTPDPSDPTKWKVVRGSPSTMPVIDVTGSSETGREIALGADGYLYWSQFHPGADNPFIDRLDIDRDPTTIPDDDSEDYYFGGDDWVVYSGLDVAFSPDENTGACCFAGECIIITEAECTTLFGEFQGVDVDCTPNPCCSPSILALKDAGPDLGAKLCDVLVTSTVDLVNSDSVKGFHAQEPAGLGGITIFGGTDEIDTLLDTYAIAPGDIITLQGFTDEFNGLFQLVGPFSYVGETGVAFFEPQLVTPADFQDGSATAESYESMLVEVECVTFVETGVFEYAPSTPYHVTDGENTFELRVATEALDLIGQPIPTESVNIVGIFSQFDDSVPPLDAGYELLPRSLADITLCGPELCAGDLNCDGIVDFDDIDPFVAALGCQGGDPNCWDPNCPWLNGDCNGDETVDFDDIDPFVARIGTTCP